MNLYFKSSPALEFMRENMQIVVNTKLFPGTHLLFICPFMHNVKKWPNIS